MAAPFFQGNINDLLNVAGQGQGSYILGQMMNRQRQSEEADIEKSVLGNLTARQNMEQSQQKFPFELQELKAKVAEWEAKTKQTQTNTAKSQFELDAEQAAGGPSAAGAALKMKREGEQFALDQKKLDAMYDELSQVGYYPPSPQTGRDFASDVGKIMEKYGLAPDSPLANNIISNARDTDTWNAFKEQMFLNTPKGRELKANREMAAASAMALQQERNRTAIRVAEIRAEAAEKEALAKNYATAVIQMEKAAEEAMLAGDDVKAQKYKERANRFAALDQAARAAGAAQGQAGRVDIEAATGGQVRTRPQPQPVVPFNDARTTAPGTTPTPVIRWGRDEQGNPVRLPQ